MSTVTVKEFELMSFFEVEPQPLDPDVPWPYSEVSYHVELGQYEIEVYYLPGLSGYLLQRKPQQHQAV
ncbi:MAG: hypothetical protein HGB11_08055 [Chlorobiales bacterium]|nr:hypothetical protein [Chlorobiales bacterium]